MARSVTNGGDRDGAVRRCSISCHTFAKAYKSFEKDANTAAAFVRALKESGRRLADREDRHVLMRPERKTLALQQVANV